MTGAPARPARPVEPPRTVVVLAKAPAPGRSKTRLTSLLTPEQAADVAAAALGDTLDAVAALPGDHVLVLDGEPGSWVPPGFVVYPQVAGGLDRRLAGAFDDTFAAHPGPVLLVGMDTPQLAPQLAAVDLDGHDAVLGMAEDGGFWAVGLRAPDPDLFVGVPMSEPTTGAAQLDRLRSCGLSVGLLPTLRDVDEPDDARAVAAAAPGTRFARRWREVTERSEVAAR
ncbi:TIGR04282 family arsenosugar biosynthesis glycosyltransferase [Cellulosimicrobium arenosum]|uniref:TIGR04282 family arsenosugar biosynthesis glycosyltransferase n=1 Tax=Cellulosimicrobium arenosum TaxID=2708133 RepID=A0A927G7Q3_9MICO|nr:TIGR04282 family arsenosugar biosynthesis glycosyltransferase [Cellulosimicrobium arenosum]MBD8078449.1 TIGR04282 family arsenosugar biosynthesis glycosyltransferase [Cellulosimicrobium arenosum]